MSIVIQSQQLGTLEIPEDQLVNFPSGIPGFPSSQRFCLVQVKPNSRFQLLQSADDPELAFVVTDPMQIDEEYPVERVRKMAEDLGIEAGEPIAVASIVTVPAPPGKPSVNMMAPLVMGVNSQTGVQVILHDSPFSVRHEL
jgi:flagellar assembly factor FliW